MVGLLFKGDGFWLVIAVGFGLIYVWFCVFVILVVVSFGGFLV